MANCSVNLDRTRNHRNGRSRLSDSEAAVQRCCESPKLDKRPISSLRCRIPAPLRLHNERQSTSRSRGTGTVPKAPHPSRPQARESGGPPGPTGRPAPGPDSESLRLLASSCSQSPRPAPHPHCSGFTHPGPGGVPSARAWPAGPERGRSSRAARSRPGGPY
jgi:hypothetical protein